MFPDHGCHGEVALNELPKDVEGRLNAMPGEWLEFELETRRIVVRHAQPSSGPDLPVIVGELVQMLALIPPDRHEDVRGGDFFVHTYDTGQFVRLHVEPGGALRIQWAKPDFAQASKKAWSGREDIAIDPTVHRLDGRVVFASKDAEGAARRIRELADTFEGLYPQGDCTTNADTASGRVELSMDELNLDATLLVDLLREVATEGTLDGRFGVTAFGREVMPEESARIVFDEGEVFVQHPVLWPSSTA